MKKQIINIDEIREEMSIDEKIRNIIDKKNGTRVLKPSPYYGEGIEKAEIVGGSFFRNGIIFRNVVFHYSYPSGVGTYKGKIGIRVSNMKIVHEWAKGVNSYSESRYPSPREEKYAIKCTLSYLIEDLKNNFRDEWDKMMSHIFRTNPFRSWRGMSHGTYYVNIYNKYDSTDNCPSYNGLWLGDYLCGERMPNTWAYQGHSLRDILTSSADEIERWADRNIKRWNIKLNCINAMKLQHPEAFMSKKSHHIIDRVIDRKYYGYIPENMYEYMYIHKDRYGNLHIHRDSEYWNKRNICGESYCFDNDLSIAKAAIKTRRLFVSESSVLIKITKDITCEHKRLFRLFSGACQEGVDRFLNNLDDNNEICLSGLNGYERKACEFILKNKLGKVKIK